MVTEPSSEDSEEAEIRIDQDSMEDMRSQLIQIHDHLLDGLEVFYKFVDKLFSHSSDDFDLKNTEGSGDDGSGDDDDLENKNREAPIMDEVKFCFHKNIIKLF